MSLTVMVTSSYEALAKKSDIKELIPTEDPIDNEFLDRLISRAGGRVRRYLGDDHQVPLTKYQAIIPAYGGVNLRLPRYPVRDVFRMFDGTDTGTANVMTATDYHLDHAGGFLYRDAGWEWTLQVESRMSGPADVVVPGGEYNRWLIEFTAGYIVSTGGLSTDSSMWSTEGGSTATGKTLPIEIEDATIELTRHMYMTRGQQAGVVSEKVGDVSVTYRDAGANSSSMPAGVADILAPFRSVV